MRKLLLPCLCLVLFMTACQKQEKESKTNNSGVVYEIFVASFNDSNGDHIGDLKGVEEKLDYLVDLGVEDIWLMPIFKSPSYHKYDVVDYYSIDESYGTMDDLDSLIKSCHSKGMKLYLDLVLNHTSNYHPWFLTAVSNMTNTGCDVEGAKCHYYNFSNTPQYGYTRINDSLYYESVFTDSMPDLNLWHQDVKNEIENIVRFYLEKGIDGFRLDASYHYFANNNVENIEFLRWFNQICEKYNPNTYIVSEVWTSFNVVKEYYRSGIDSLFDFDLSDGTGQIVSAIRNKNGAALASSIVNKTIAIKQANKNGVDAIFLSNHDMARSGGFIPNADQQKLAASVYLLAPGKPFIYYGEEIGMRGSGKDENKRLAMLWGQGNDCYSPKNFDYTSQVDTSVLKQQKDDDSLWNHYKKLLEIRAQYPMITSASATSVDLKDSTLFAIKLYGEGQTIYVVHNFSDQVKEIELKNIKLTQSTNKNNKESNGNYTIAPYSSMILEDK